MKYEVYHGRSVSDTKFDLKYVGGADAIDGLGPGFYFTDIESEAARFSGSDGIVIKANITIDNPLSTTDTLTESDVKYMIDNSPSVKHMNSITDIESDEYLEAFYDTPLSDFAESVDAAYDMSISAYSSLSEYDGMLTISRDFYDSNSTEYLTNLYTLGYDGIIMDGNENGNAIIYVVFNPNQIELVSVNNFLSESLYSFIKDLIRDNNSSLVESILAGFNVIFESKNGTIKLYRGLESKFDPSYDLNVTDAPTGYSTWTDNSKLAREYAGANGYVYQIELPISELKDEYIDDEGERALYFNNNKAAGLNDISGNEYLVYNDHELFNINSITLSNGPIVESNELVGGKADGMTIYEIANIHKVDVNQIQSELEMGIGIEMEHTDNSDIAVEIAMDHLAEIPDYYTRLEKMESEAGITEAVSYNKNEWLHKYPLQSDNIRFYYIQQAIYEPTDEKVNIKKLTDTWDGYDDLVFVERTGNRIRFYEGFVKACWDELYNKSEYKNLTKDEAVDKMVRDRFTKIANDLNLDLVDYKFDGKHLMIDFNVNPENILAEDDEPEDRSKDKGNSRSKKAGNIVERSLLRSGEGGNDIAGGIGGIMTGLREMKNSVTGDQTEYYNPKSISDKGRGKDIHERKRRGGKK